MRHLQKINYLIFAATILCLLAASIASAAYDPTWTKSQCDTYSSHGLKERYVYGSNKGWIDNNVWDDATVEGVDCASYVCRSLALPEYVAEGTAAPYPYTTTKLIVGVPNTTEVSSVNNLQQWDLWVYVTSSSKHTGLFKQYSGTSIITREARSATSGVVEGSFSKQSLIDKGTRFWRRANWSSAPQLPTVSTVAATGILYSSATLNAAITSNGNAAIDDVRFAWGSTSACSDGLADGTLSGTNFSCTLTGLNSSTTYYFKAQAHNSVGWASGAVLSFKTAAAPVSSGIIVDNGQTGTSSTGTWSASSTAGFYGANSLLARDGATYTWSFSSQTAGFYEVFMWWTEYSSRGSAIPVKINYTDGPEEITVNQQTDGGQWNFLGEYYFNTAGSVTLTANGSYPTTHCADAVKFVLVQANKRPVATIASITPNPSQAGQYITFTGSGTDDGSVSAYEWTSSINGKFGTSASVITSALNPGTHVISFRVRDNLGIWSAAAENTITVVNPSGELIIDNGNAGTSSTGVWQASGATNPWGANSLWARDGATYSWSATALTPGTYEVFMWWTELSSRSTAAAIQVAHANGSAGIFINQKTNGGQWNSLGQFTFNTSGKVTLFAPGAYPTSFCADAVKFVKVNASPDPIVLPVTAGFTSAVTNGIAPLTVTFADQSSGSGINSWQWDFDNDGIVDSTAQNPSYTYTAVGVYTVRLVVFGQDSSDELIKTDYIKTSAPEVIIVDNGAAGTSSTGTWTVSGGANPYGSDSLYARAANSVYTWSFTPQKGGTYEVYLWWTGFSSRGTAIPVTITHSLGTADLTVNQQTNGGQWNSVGTYTMNAGQAYRVGIYTPGDDSTVSADAVRILRISE